MERDRKVLRILFGALLLLCVLWFFLAGILVNCSTEKLTVTVSSTEMFKHWKLIGREKHVVVWDSSIYVSKRRVSNGPDPIHSRNIMTEFEVKQPLAKCLGIPRDHITVPIPQILEIMTNKT